LSTVCKKGRSTKRRRRVLERRRKCREGGKDRKNREELEGASTQRKIQIWRRNNMGT
jgi:hypothetical protein